MANFFGQQEDARQQTTQLVAIYGVTVLLLILGVYATVLSVLEYGVGPSLFEEGSALESARAAAYGDGAIVWVRPWILAIVSAAILTFIGGAGLFQMRSLRDGGHIVARRLHGTKIDPAQAMGLNRQLLNVVEEMAVAAGMPAPPVYVLPEKGINAFSAGLTPEDAVIGVTRAAVDRLDRDELQGMVAHETSHILNGDMRLNLRLMAWTHGIQLLSTLGRKLLYGAVSIPIGLGKGVWRTAKMFFGILRGGEQGSQSESSGRFGCCAFAFVAFVLVPLFLYILSNLVMAMFMGTVPILLVVLGTPAGRMILILATALAVLGGLCYLGGLLIKARVSKEREVLADAAAVQFTRNPEGIGGALLKLRDCEHGGAVQAPYAGTVRHLFFGSVNGTTGLLSTHPSTEERLRRIDPSLLERSASGGEGHADDSDSDASTLSPEDLVERAGTLSPEMLAQARALHESIPTDLLDAAHQSLGAVALSYALVLDEDESMRCDQLDLLWKQETPPVFDETKRLYDRVADLDRSLRLPLVEMAAPSLQGLSAEQRERLRETIRALAEADDRITIFELALETMVRHALDPASSTGRAEGTGLAAVQEDVVALLSGLAQAGHEDEDAVRSAFASGYDALAEAHDLPAATPTAAGPEALHAALDRLARTPDALRKEVLQACARCATADETIARAEEDVLRAVAVAVGVPLPVSVSQETGPGVASSEASGAT